MVKLGEHIEKMKSIKKQAENSTGNKKKELMKCYHRLQKQLYETRKHMLGE